MTRATMLTVVTRHIETIIETAKGRPISEEISMRDLGADSLEIVEAVSRSMKELRLRVPRTELSKARNLKDLLDLFEAAAAGGAALR